MKKKVGELVLAAVDGAATVSVAEVDKFIGAARRRRPHMSHEELVTALERSYLGLVTTSGAAAGGLAALPGVGLPGGAVAAVADVGAFTTATAIYVLALASVHDIEVNDLERRKALLLAVLAGPGGANVIQRFAGRAGSHWGARVTRSIPIETIRQINRVLGPNVVTKYGTKQGIFVIGKMAPFGVGMAVGGVGNAVMARAAIASLGRPSGRLRPPPLSSPPVPGDMTAGGRTRSDAQPARRLGALSGLVCVLRRRRGRGATTWSRAGGGPSLCRLQPWGRHDVWVRFC